MSSRHHSHLSSHCCFPRLWTTRGKRVGCTYSCLKKQHVLLSIWHTVLLLWTIGLLWIHIRRYFPNGELIRAHPLCINITSILLLFSPSISFHPVVTLHQRPQLTPRHRATWMSSDGTWLSTCLMSLGSASLPITKRKKTSEARSRWSCPFEVSLLLVMERVGSHSPDWVLGSVQAAAVNEPRCSLLCHARTRRIPRSRFICLCFCTGN